MVAGARLAIEAGHEVRGSDTPLYPPASHMAAALGVPIAEGYAPGNLAWGPDLVVIGNALSRGNPEVEAALTRGLHYVSLPEFLKDAVLRARRPAVIAGTHGKTTTTALTAHILTQCGLDPGFLIGGEAFGFPHPARLGPEGAPFVIEGDEYDSAFFDKRAKFLHYLPELAAVTSVEFDHGDIYRDLAEIRLAFERMLRQMPAHGRLFLCADNAAAELAPQAFCPVETYGFAGHADWHAVPLAAADGLSRMTVHHGGRAWGEAACPLAGRHNLQNALAAIAIASHLGAPPSGIIEALRGFPGVRRRLELYCEAEGVAYVDDFAHHPTAIRETLRAARDRWPGRRLRALFEPRSNTLVTKRFQPELTDALAHADSVWIGPVHRADQIPEADRLDRNALRDALARAGVEAHCPADVPALLAGVLETSRPGDIVLTLSNGAFGGLREMIVEAVQPAGERNA